MRAQIWAHIYILRPCGDCLRRVWQQPPDAAACNGRLLVGHAGSSLSVPVSKRPGAQLKTHAARPARITRMSLAVLRASPACHWLF
jgi:hypothetical protein